MNKIYSYAKLNFFLDIISKYEDGFHEIRSLFCQVSLFDLIEYQYNNGNGLHVFDKKNILPEENLLIKAGRLFEKYTGEKINFNFFINKKIPIGGGLGGGSSNAACILKILDHEFKTHLGINRLKNLAMKLGSDVPFFIQGGIQQVFNKGDILKKIKIKKNKLNILLIFPEINVSTMYAYQLIDMHNLCYDSLEKKIMFKKLIEGFKTNNYSMIISNIYNKFEEIIFIEFPMIKKIYCDILDSNADKVFMSGSGSTLAGLYSTQKSLEEGSCNLKKIGYNVIPVSILY